jgi:endonuclease G
MGRIDYQDAVAAAARHQTALAVQGRVATVQTDAEMLNQRRAFMRPSDRVFFESIIEGSDMLPIRYLELGQVAARPVGRIEVPAIIGRGTGYATGFLVAPGLLLTNQHVLRSADWAAAATLTLDAEDTLDGLPRVPRVFRLRPDDLFVADTTLDFALVSVAERATDGTRLAEFGFLRLFEQTGKITRDEYASIIQHPNGRQKHLAARNNKISVYVYDDDLPADQRDANNFLYYQTDTLRGSSGAPVFSDQWYVVALHRRGVPNTTLVDGERVIVRLDGSVATPQDSEDAIQYVSNEGVRVSRMIARLRELAADSAYPMRESASRAIAALDLLHDVGDGPVATPVAVPSILRGEVRASTPRRGDLALDGLEITRRPLELFADAEGYDPTFLHGVTLSLPTPSAALRRALAPRIDAAREYLLPFQHFTTAMHAKRRLPIFAAVNIDGKRRPTGGMGPRPPWSFDPRIAEEHQPDDSIFSNVLQRGHLAAREYVVWGAGVAERRAADVHSFTLTNVCPQIRAFNAVQEWYQVERQVVAEAKHSSGGRITEFVGPILRADDPTYDSLRGRRSNAEWHTRIRIPLRFWKIIAWVQDGVLEHRAFVLDQSDELDEAGPLEMDIEAPEGVRESSIEEIAELTDLVFKGF